MQRSLRRTFLVTVFLLFPSGRLARSCPADWPLPRVSAAALPLYPLLPHMANIEGTVRIRVTTDGHQIVVTQVEEGNRLLAAAAGKNLGTWRFETHKPVSFEVTFRYKVVPRDEWRGDRDNPVITLRLPTEVEVSALRWPPAGDLPTEIRHK